MGNCSFEKLLSELKSVRLILKIFTFLHIALIILFFINIVTINSLLIIVVYLSFIIFFLSFIWFKMPATILDKIGETLLIVFFGLFALWMWIPDKKELEKMIGKTKK